MTSQQMIDLVNQYFGGVDHQNIAIIKGTMSPDCNFSVETHGVKLQGYDQIENMFERLWASHAAVRHQNFIYVPSPENGLIAARFQVVNTHHDGQLTHKSNCNFFEIRDSLFSSIAVYMAGQNTLDMSD